MNNTITVPFHNDELLIVEYNGQPYTPMKPIVDGMGLDWKSQFVKLKQKFISTVVEITIVANDGKERLMTCIPIRKLPAWLYSVHANKVKPELRDKVIMYQTECDDVLWEYWTKGQAVNERKTINQEQQDILSCTVEDRAKGDKKTEKKIWSQLHRHFKIKDFRELLAIHYLDAVRFLHQLEINISIGHPQMPLLPVPFQKGRYLVVVGEDGAVNIRDAKGFELVDTVSIEKFKKEVLTMYVETTEFVCRLSYLQDNLTLEGHEEPRLGILKEGKNIIDFHR